MFLQTKQIITSFLSLVRLPPQRTLETYPGSSYPPAPHSPNLAAQVPRAHSGHVKILPCESGASVQDTAPPRLLTECPAKVGLLHSWGPLFLHSCISCFLPLWRPESVLSIPSLHSSCPPTPAPPLKRPHWFQTHSIVKDSVEFLVLLPAAPKCWDYRCVSPAWFHEVLGTSSAPGQRWVAPPPSPARETVRCAAHSPESPSSVGDTSVCEGENSLGGIGCILAASRG